MYLDCVVNNEKEMKPIFNAMPQDVKNWLAENAVGPETRVVIGKTLKVVTVNEYLNY